MMYVEFMKNFLFADWSDPSDDSSEHEKFSSRRFERADGFRLILASWFDSYFLDMIYVEFMKNVVVADSSELLAVRLILASWDQKCLILTF